MLKNKVIRILSIIILVIGVLLVVYKLTSKEILDGKIVEIKSGKIGEYLNYAMDDDIKKQVLNDKDGYIYLTYRFEIKNISDKNNITNVSIEPSFSDNMKDNVVWYDYTDAVTDSEMRVSPSQIKHYDRVILIKKNGYTDDELINMAKEDKFEISYYVDGSFIHGKKLVGYEGE